MLLTSTTLLASCSGGASSSTNISAEIQETSHPIFARSLVKTSVTYELNGEIKDKSPTFSWKATEGATYYLLGHEDTESESRWTEYKLSAADANCAIGTICTYKPQNLQLAVGDEKVCWVKAEISTGWKNWSDGHVFKIIKDNTSSTIATPITPAAVLTTATPTFKWTPGNGASEYQRGMENFDSTDWKEYTISASQANCSSTERSFKPNNLTLSNGDQKTW